MTADDLRRAARAVGPESRGRLLERADAIGFLEACGYDDLAEALIRTDHCTTADGGQSPPKKRRHR